MVFPFGEAYSFRGVYFLELLSCGLKTCKKETLSHPQGKIAESSPATILHCLGSPFQQPALLKVWQKRNTFGVTWKEEQKLRFFLLQVQTNKENDAWWCHPCIPQPSATIASPGVEQPVPQLQHSEGATPTSDMEGPNPPGPLDAIAGASKTLRHAKDGSGEWIPSDRGGGRKDLNFRAFFPSFFLEVEEGGEEKKGGWGLHAKHLLAAML